MPPVVNPLTFEEHRELGKEILEARARMSNLSCLIAEVYGAESSAAFTFRKTTEVMDKLCIQMETQAELDCPGLNASSFYR